MPSDSLAHQAALTLQNELADLTGAKWKVEPVHSGATAWFTCKTGDMTRDTDPVLYRDVLFIGLDGWIKRQAELICSQL